MNRKDLIIPLILLALANAGVGTRAFAHEGTGRAGLKEPLAFEIETEFYAGKRGYLHGGLGVVSPLNARQKIGIVGHFVREETGAELFPSLGAEFIQDFGNGYEAEAFTFGYSPVENQRAWAVGLRGSKELTIGDHVKFTPFFGPTYARVRAIDELTSAPVTIEHLMLFGGVAVEAGAVKLTLFGSHSFFSRDPRGLETHVDLEEMTHYATYENIDGFARNSVGAELSCSPTERLTLNARYALIRFDDATRHSISFNPSVKLGSQWEVFAGFQLLRGDGPDNDLLMTGVSFSF